MSVLALVFVLALLGVVTWAVVTFIPMPQQIKTMIIATVTIVALFYVLNAFGVFGAVSGFKVPQISR